MIKYTVKVDGMQCSMCEAHINDAVRKAFPAVKKVSSSHTKKETVVISDTSIDREALKDAIDATGYSVQSVQDEPYERGGLFSFFKR